MSTPIAIDVFGEETVCASCVNAPSSKDTYEWLQAAIGRKYPDAPIRLRYVDINRAPADERDAAIIEKIRDDAYFYPLVIAGEDVLGEGYVQLKPIFSYVEARGWTPA